MTTATPKRFVEISRYVLSHRGLLILIGLGVLLRALIPIAYGPAFYFSDTKGYFEYAELMIPAQIRPYGYSALLNVFQPTGSVVPVIVTQNLMGLACGVAIYALVLRKGGPRWLAIAAATPIVLDAYALVLEHYLLADTMFTFLLVLGFVFLMWEEKLSVKFAIIGGLLLAGALLTRTVGTPLVLLVGAYVLIRRVGWRQIIALGLAAGIPLIGYLAWFHNSYGVYSFSTWQDRWMYGRVMSIADCDNLKLSAETKPLCERDPDYAYDVDFYVWSHNSPVIKVKRQYIYEFIGEVIKQQPGDYTKLVLRESWAYFSPDFYFNRHEPKGTTCPGMWQFSSRISEPGCTPRPVASSRWGDHKGEIPDRWSGPLPAFFNSYSKSGTLPGPVLLAGLLLVAVAIVAPLTRRGTNQWRRGGRARLDAALLGSSALALVVGAIASSQFDIRYGVPNIALIPIAAAMAWISLRAPELPEPTEPEPETAAEPDAPTESVEMERV